MEQINLSQNNEKIKLNIEIERIKKTIKKLKIIITLFICAFTMSIFIAGVAALTQNGTLFSLALYIFYVGLGIFCFFALYKKNNWLNFFEYLVKNPNDYQIIRIEIKNTFGERYVKLNSSECFLEILYRLKGTNKVCTKTIRFNLKIVLFVNIKGIPDIEVKIDNNTVYIAENLPQEIEITGDKCFSIAIDEKQFEADINALNLTK